MRISDWSSDVCSSDLAELHFSLAHDAAPSVAAAAGAAPSTGASPTGGTASGTPSPSSSLAALGLARVTVSENAYGSPFTAPVASMIDSSGVVIQQIGSAHVCTPVTNAHLVCRLPLEKNKHNK